MTKGEFCRICGQKLPPQAKERGCWYPFCSQRCRWLDLGKWFNQEYHLAEGKAPPDAPGGNNSGRQ